MHDGAVVPEDEIPDFPLVSVGELRTGAVLHRAQNELAAGGLIQPVDLGREDRVDVQRLSSRLVVSADGGLQRVRHVGAESLAGVPGLRPVELGAQLLGECVVGQVLVGEDRPAAFGGEYVGLEHRDDRRGLVPGHVGVPLAEPIVALALGEDDLDVRRLLNA